MKFKPKEQQVRMVYSSSPVKPFPECHDKVFAVIGPFEDFHDKMELQQAFEMLLRGWNLDSETTKSPTTDH